MLPNLISKFMRPFSSMTMGVTPIGSAIGNLPANTEKATIAAGCFWGVEHIYRKHFENKGLLDARVGYIGGDTNNPSYRLVCRGDTGHAEALQVLYDPEKVSYETLIEFFFRMHDPTTPDRQGPDVGSQYRSAIFYHSPEQESTAKKIITAAQKEWFKGQNIATEVIPAGQWWDAEDYHQLYLNNNPGGYECPSQ
ncbi:Peptide methionine sulfoxide reductase [Maublancomyces gigas]|uniref:peptide-methionine (S)-S-oxide reductase n=1 Tax=Discina gigas TaxID=1032678 RepID=A0ABR3GIK8_9PEZI